MLVAKIDGLVLATYDRDGKTKEGKPYIMHCADMYVGHDLVQVAKIPDSVALAVGEKVENLPVKVYNGQYGLSCVYNSDEGGTT